MTLTYKTVLNIHADGKRQVEILETRTNNPENFKVIATLREIIGDGPAETDEAMLDRAEGVIDERVELKDPEFTRQYDETGALITP